MRKIGLFLVLLGLGSACPPSTPPPNDGGQIDGGGGGGGGNSAWTYYDLDTHAKNTPYIAMAVDSANQKIGVAYYVDTGITVDAGAIDAGLHDGTRNWEVHYLEWQAGTVSGQKTLTTVQRPVGIAASFQPNGEPVVAYLGGDGADITGMSNYWFQSDPELQYRSGGANWTKVVAPFTMSADITAGDTQPGDSTMCMSGVDTAGFVLGLWPAITIDSTNKLYWVFRDVHSGQFPQQDWGGSDVKMAVGTNFGGWAGTCIKAGGDNKLGWGGHNQIVLGPNELPALIFDQIPMGPDNDGQSIFFTQLQSNGNWADLRQITPTSDLQTGAALAYDATEGFGIAWVDVSTQSKLYYDNSADGTNWNTATPIFGSGTGGWFPSMAVDPVHHEPAVAFYVCSNTSGKTEGNCTADDELDVIQRISGNWQIKLVDDFGSVAAITGYQRVLNKIGFFGEKRFVVYRLPQGDTLRLAVEK